MGTCEIDAENDRPWRQKRPPFHPVTSDGELLLDRPLFCTQQYGEAGVYLPQRGTRERIRSQTHIAPLNRAELSCPPPVDEKNSHVQTPPRPTFGRLLWGPAQLQRYKVSQGTTILHLRPPADDIIFYQSNCFSISCITHLTVIFLSW
jgi:hypothetical protein